MAAIFQVPKMTDLVAEPTEDELLAAIEEPLNRKAPVQDKSLQKF